MSAIGEETAPGETLDLSADRKRALAVTPVSREKSPKLHPFI
jgi:hypothetical protein